MRSWSADFITAENTTGEAGEPAVYLRREFHVVELPMAATLRSTALGLTEPHLNGNVVGDEVLAPGWTSYRHRLVVSSHDVTELITVGANAVGIVLGEGWAVGRLGWEGKRRHYSDRPAAWLELELQYADGSTDVIGTDSTFRAGAGGVRANSIYDGEEFDARLEPVGWDCSGFDDSGWGAVETVQWPRESLVEPIAPPIRRIEELAPVEVTRTPAGRTVVDFGQNISGWVRLTVDAPAGTAITLRHSEVMIEGEADYETLRTAAATDRYIVRGDGAETWEPRFTFHGFRYVEISGWPGVLDDRAIRAVVVHSDMRRTGWFETSHPLLNRLHDNTVWSMRDNFVGVPTDCPQRDERLGWTGDLNAFAPSAAFLYDVRGMLGSWLRDLAVEQQEKGFVPWVVPDVLSTPSSPTALWSDVAVSLPWTLYREYGDERILADAYDSMTAFIRQVAGLLDEHGLWSTGFQYGDWLDPDAPIDNPTASKTDRHLVAAAYLCRTTREMAQTARILGRSDDETGFAALAERVRDAFRDEYVSATGRVVNESATAYALAITFDILDDAQKRHAGDRLADIVARAGYRISTGFAGTPLVTDALTTTGHLDVAYLLLLETGCPSFLYPVTMGATTVWERWDAILPDGTLNASGMTSLNHYALGAVVDWMHRTIGGLTALKPGYRHMRIAPSPGKQLSSASLRHLTVHGEVLVAWRVEDGIVTLDVRIPGTTTAEVVLPLHPDGVTVDIAEGDHHWSYAAIEVLASSGFDLHSTIREVAENEAAWQAYTETLVRHHPQFPIGAPSPEMASMTISSMLDFIPGASDQLRSDLITALTAIPIGASV